MRKLYFSILLLAAGISLAYTKLGAPPEAPELKMTSDTINTVKQVPPMEIAPLHLIKAHAADPLSRSANASEASTALCFMPEKGLYSFSLAKPRSMTNIGSILSEYFISGDRVNDSTYYLITPGDKYSAKTLSRLNTNTLELVKVADFTETLPIFPDLSYDYANSRMLAIASEYSTIDSYLYEIDLATGITKRLASYPSKRFYTIACGAEGDIWTIDVNGHLWRINPDYSLYYVGNTGYATKYMCSMDFDRTGHNLYYVPCDANVTSTLLSIDLRNGAATKIDQAGLARSAEIQCLSIEYIKAPEEAPTPISEWTVTPTSSGLEMKWTNPAKSEAGTTLNALEAVELYCDGTLLKTYNPTPGTVTSDKIKGLATGMHLFKLIAKANGKNSELREMTAWAGADVPAAPKNVKVQRVDDSSANLSWEAPTEGLHKGWLDPDNIKYRISRIAMASGDSVVVEKVYRKGLEYTDVSLTVGGRYHYTVQSLAEDYGGMNYSDTIYLGPPLEVPYSCAFETSDEYALWKTYDRDGDGRVWQEMVYWPYVVNFSSFCQSAVDDWIISPPIRLEAGKQYYLYCWVYSGLGEDYPKTLDITIGSDQTPESQSVVRTIDFNTKTDHYLRAAYTPQTSGVYHVGVRDRSVRSTSSVRMSNVWVMEKHTGSISGKITDEKGNPLAGVRAEFDNTDEFCITGEDGSYFLDFAETGSYPVSFTLYGYETIHKTVDVENDKTTTLYITMPGLPKEKIHGTITDTNGKKIANCELYLKGYGADRYAYTDKDGYFSIPDVFVGNYTLTYDKYKYQVDSVKIAMGNEAFNASKTISPKILEPSDAEAALATGETTKVLVKWNNPRDLFRHDSGILASQTGSLAGTKYYVFGAVFRKPALIKSLQWMTSTYQGPHDSINLFIFDINPDLTPSNRILYSLHDVKSKGDTVWNYLELPEPVAAPNGYYLAASYEGMVSLGMDSGSDEGWPYIKGINFNSQDYRNNVWNKVASKRNYLIRATGDELGQACEYDYRYKVWRLNEDNLFDESKWDYLGETQDNQLTDNLSGQNEGNYFYAIRAIYGDKQSEPIFTDNVEYVPDGVATLSTDNITIWPIPARDVINVEGARFDSAAVYSLDGIAVAQSQNDDVMNVSHLNTGIYILKLKIGKRIIIRRIIKL